MTKVETTTNYEQLKTVCKQRKNHVFRECREYCKFLESLHYSKFIMEGKTND